MGETVEMIDLHNHILPGLDDGPRTMEESIRMCRIAYQDGIRTIVATPHTLNGVYQNGKSIILSKVDELNDALNNSELKLDSAIRNLSEPEGSPSGAEAPLSELEDSPSRKLGRRLSRRPQSEIDLRILPGADVRLCEELLSRLEEGTVMTVGDGGKFLFIEFPSQGIPYRTEEVLFQLMGRGFTPIITHPERNVEISQRHRRYYEMIRKGCLGQVTAMSLTGEFGPKVRQVAEKLLKNRLIQFIATDAHSINERPPILSSAVKEAAKIVGKKEAEKMVTEYPEAILEGKRPQAPEPLPL
jgi:protein-tyrosine phosphatase